MGRAIGAWIGAAGLAMWAGAASGSTPASIEYVDPGYIITDISQGGAAGAGNSISDSVYETFRWTAATGVVRLGRATVPVIGTGAGTPDISYDGTRVSATIISSDVLATQGIWTLGQGWVETMPPPPVGSVPIDQSYGSAWGLSGDGATVTGFYWTPKAQACRWSQATGMVALPQGAGHNARVNAANYDGTVVVGWEERNDGAWQPTAWRGTTKFPLVNTDYFAEAQGVNGDGSVVVGESPDLAIATVVATIWRWNGSSYDMEQVGVLPGTQRLNGFGSLSSVSDDGQIAVGYNRYTQDPFAGPVDGTVWTPSTGLIKDTDFLDSIGVSVAPSLDIREFVAVSPDGTAITGYGTLRDTGVVQSFVIHLPVPGSPADLNGDGVVNSADLALLLGSWGACPPPCPADLDGDGSVGSADLAILLGSWG